MSLAGAFRYALCIVHCLHSKSNIERAILFQEYTGEFTHRHKNQNIRLICMCLVYDDPVCTPCCCVKCMHVYGTIVLNSLYTTTNALSRVETKQTQNSVRACVRVVLSTRDSAMNGFFCVFVLNESVFVCSRQTNTLEHSRLFISVRLLLTIRSMYACAVL